jgi:alpha-N-arabinofuranosidase
VALGKYGDGFDNTNDKGQADPYTACVRRALENGWHKGRVGGHTVRNNTISQCGQTGVVGSLGGAFSTIADNEISNCNWGQTFAGAEMACIKLHGAVDTVIEGNHLFNCSAFSMWLDWMAQG